jgi:4-aminobutyrate aminotransferase-like enzyme
MVAFELCHDRDPARPAPEAAASITARCRQDRVLVLPAGPHGNVIRVLSPLVIRDADLERGLDAIDRAVVATSEDPRVTA